MTSLVYKQITVS